MSNPTTRESIYTARRMLNDTLAAKGVNTVYSLEIWSPGDGWSRYQLFDESRGHWEMSLAMTARECYQTLHCLLKLAERL